MVAAMYCKLMASRLKRLARRGESEVRDDPARYSVGIRHKLRRLHCRIEAMPKRGNHHLGDCRFAVCRFHLQTPMETGWRLHVQTFRGFRRDFHENPFPLVSLQSPVLAWGSASNRSASFPLSWRAYARLRARVVLPSPFLVEEDRRSSVFKPSPS